MTDPRTPVVPGPGPGQESVWDYPRPPRLEPSRHRVRVLAGDARDGFTVLADVAPADGAAWRVLETSHPPTYYVARHAVLADWLQPGQGQSLCEWKGQAAYDDVVSPDGTWRVEQAAWSYADPTPGFEALAGALAFYPGKLRCEVGGELVRAQAGGFYGGWITDEVVGPFKGEPGTWGW